MLDIEKLEKIEDKLPLSSLILLYLIMTADSMKTLLPCRIRKLSETNLIYKHLIGFLTLLIFVELGEIAEEKEKFSSVIKMTSILYLWFILTTKMYYPLFIILCLVFLIIYILHIYRKREYKNPNKNKNLKNIKDSLYIFSIIITIIGVIIYYFNKKNEYKNNFNILKFIFGTINHKCNFK